MIKDVIGEVEEFETGNEGDLGWNRAGDLIGGDGEVAKVLEVADVGGERAGEVESGDVEGGNVMVGVARDAGPRAVGDGGVPGGEGGGLGAICCEGGFEGEKCTVFR